jgi:hypothetical protein
VNENDKYFRLKTREKSSQAAQSGSRVNVAVVRKLFFLVNWRSDNGSQKLLIVHQYL